MLFRCKIGWHKYEDGEIQTVVGIRYGGSEVPGMRLRRKCKNCGHIDYVKLTLDMPTRDVYNDSLYRLDKE